jgi:hypothetical protein
MLLQSSSRISAQPRLAGSSGCAGPRRGAIQQVRRLLRACHSRAAPLPRAQRRLIGAPPTPRDSSHHTRRPWGAMAAGRCSWLAAARRRPRRPHARPLPPAAGAPPRRSPAAAAPPPPARGSAACGSARRRRSPARPARRRWRGRRSLASSARSRARCPSKSRVRAQRRGRVAFTSSILCIAVNPKPSGCGQRPALARHGCAPAHHAISGRRSGRRRAGAPPA